MSGESERPWAYSAFRVEVTATRRLSPGFVRITLSGPALRHFAPWGVDQRIKIVLPMPDGSTPDFGLLDEPTPHPSDWFARWRALPASERNVLRTYTPAAIRPELEEIDVDFFLHEPAGPASAWAVQARRGDHLVVTGPDARNGYTGYGIAFTPGDADRFLLVGDETAYPAIRNILRALPPQSAADVLVEAADARDVVLDASSRRISLSIVEQGEVPGERLEHEVRRWSGSLPHAGRGTQGLYVWIAGETGMVTRTRRHLVTGAGVPKSQIAFLGYWRLGGPLSG